MAQLNPNSQPAGNLWRGVLNRIPTILGRLTYVAGLRDPVTNAYSHPLLSQAVGGEEADLTLRHSHYKVFSEWLALGLEGQKADLSRFLASEGRTPKSLRARDLIPPQAREVETQLYLTDLEMLLHVLHFEKDAGTRGE